MRDERTEGREGRKRRSSSAGRRRKKKYRVKKRFFVFLLILLLCLAGIVRCTVHRLTDGDSSPDGGSTGFDGIGADGSEGGSVQRTAIASTEAWKLTLVNKSHRLPEDYTVETAAIAGDTAGHTFDARAVDSLNRMLADAKEAGLDVMVCSAYRTIEYQENLIAAQVAKYVAQGLSQAEAEARTATEIIEPGASEHNLGLAVDLVARSYQTLDAAQASTAENQWLLANCTRYGFILRYPDGKQEITGIIYEPWHFRYVGEAAASEIMEQGLCLEEYLGQN